MTKDTDRSYTVEVHEWCPTDDDREAVSTLTEAIATATRSLESTGAGYALAVVRDDRGLMVYAADSNQKTWERAEPRTTPPVSEWREEVASSC